MYYSIINDGEKNRKKTFLIQKTDQQIKKRKEKKAIIS